MRISEDMLLGILFGIFISFFIYQIGSVAFESGKEAGLTSKFISQVGNHD